MLEIIKDLSVGQILKRGAAMVPGKTALVDGERRMTYKELDDMTDTLAAGLSELGFKKGDRVAIYMKSSLEFVVAFYALQKLGIIVAWVNAQYRKADARFILKNSGARGVFIFGEWDGYDYLDSITDIKKDLPNLESVFIVGNGEGDGIYQFNRLLELGAQDNSGTKRR